ncbi:hypothetical protein HIM_04927 [Hirsutella minnesotensis 3608]|uniref:Transcription elongation factor Eaf N-terminal domain-containing protein n=1 Tax=Hirsutella minnesotensis 3608 TaxID=1043627 RepID=A0A0F7ZPM7_9HYPO|nr:hypothetical protein HIM_04927 [Hirsutella minnesotensis 3608]
MAALIDPTVKGKYPVILGDGMLGRTSNEIFTGVRYNHKPTLSSSDGPAHAKLKPSQPGKTTSYDLTYTDGGASYAYVGTRNLGGNQYVLHFDADRKVFILDKIDSTFDMNVTRLPGNSDPAKLKSQYPHLETLKLESQKPESRKPESQKPDSSAESTTKATSEAAKPRPKAKPAPKTAAAKSPVHLPKQPRRKVEKKQPAPAPAQNDIALSLPKPEPPKEQKKSAKRIEEEEEEDEDDDGGLLVEYPGGDNAGAKMKDFSPAFPAFPARRFDDFMDQRDSEGDADGESDGDLDLDFKLPSPVNNNTQAALRYDGQAHDESIGEEPASVDMEDDLEKEMEIAFEDLANSQEGSPDGGDESEISEED